MLDGSFSVSQADLDPPLPEGKCTLIIGQVEEGSNNGQKPVLSIGNINKVTDYPKIPGREEQGPDTHTYLVTTGGNVISDPNLDGGTTTPEASTIWSAATAASTRSPRTRM